MEKLAVSFNNDSFDRVVHGKFDDKPVLKEAGDLAIFVRDQATQDGKPAAVLTFTVQLPDGSLARAQTVTTLALLDAALSSIRGRGISAAMSHTSRQSRSTITTDPSDPRLNQPRPDGQQQAYLVLSEEERAKGFVRPLRFKYRHVGVRPTHPTRPLTNEEQERFKEFGYVAYEQYTGGGPEAGRYWTQAKLDSGCGAETIMSQAIAETYARDPKFYGFTYCCTCRKHLPVEEFVWVENGQVTGQRLGS